jgi:MYXO-CTERM domain-containing protein
MKTTMYVGVGMLAALAGSADAAVSLASSATTRAGGSTQYTYTLVATGAISSLHIFTVPLPGVTTYGQSGPAGWEWKGDFATGHLYWEKPGKLATDNDPPGTYNFTLEVPAPSSAGRPLIVTWDIINPGAGTIDGRTYANLGIANVWAPIPAPGALGLAAAAGLVSRRRRR